MSSDTQSPVAAELAQLEGMSRTELRAVWQKDYGNPAPKKISRDLLIRSAAYRIQERVEGGLSKVVLQHIAAMANANKPPPTGTRVRRIQLKPGTRLIREWRGCTHKVTVTETGFTYREQSFKSLSEVARAIAGTRWSGPAFFGLKGGKGKEHRDAT